MSFETPQNAVIAPKKLKWTSSYMEEDPLFIAKRKAAQQAKLKAMQAAQALIKPLEPLTEDEWNGLIGKARWDSIVALRGPDLRKSQTLKFFTSAVIRHRLSRVMRTGGLVNAQIPFVIIPHGHGQSYEGMFCAEHFFGHIHEAAVWLGIPIAWVPAAQTELLLTGEHHSLTAKKLSLDEPFKGILGAWLQLTGYGDSPVSPSSEEVPSCPE